MIFATDFAVARPNAARVEEPNHVDVLVPGSVAQSMTQFGPDSLFAALGSSPENESVPVVDAASNFASARRSTVRDDFPTRRSVASATRHRPSRDASRRVSTPRSRKVSVRFEKAPKRRSSIGSKLFSLTALLGAGALLVGTSIPANAFMESQGSELAAVAAPSAPGQSLAVSSNVASAAPIRDSFEAISYAEVLRLQYSGANYSFTATSGAVRWPFPYPVPMTDQFGIPRPDGPHKGLDFAPGVGTPIYSIAAGTVILSQEDNSGYGNHVIIQHNLGGVDVKSHYTHMISGSSPLKVGDTVNVGDFIGLVGETGITYGANMHFEILIDNVLVDPYLWLTANAVN